MTTSRLTADAVYRVADRHRRLRTRRYELLPLTGDGAAFSDIQGRGWGTNTTTSPAELEDLISSIATVGQLQPILVEEHDDQARRVVSGERRLRAMKWGAHHHPDNPHFTRIAAVIVDGPLSDEERRSWQLIENLARADLQPGELAAALLYERCAVLTSRLLTHGVAVPVHIATLDDPVARFEALDQLRRHTGHHHVGAPWHEVIARIGIQLSEDKAKKLVQAFRAIPVEVSSEMDAAEVSLHSRLEYLRLYRGRRDAAEEIWATLLERDQPQLLTRAVGEAEHQPAHTAAAVADAAETFHEAANRARAETLSQRLEGPELVGDLPNERTSEVAAVFLAAGRRLRASLESGQHLSRYDTGSVLLMTNELIEIVKGADTRHDDAGH